MSENEQNSSTSSSEEETEQSSEGDIGTLSNYIVPYEPFADSDASSFTEAQNEEQNEEQDEDGLSSTVLERRFEKIDPVQSWYVSKLDFLFYLQVCDITRILRSDFLNI